MTENRAGRLPARAVLLAAVVGGLVVLAGTRAYAQSGDIEAGRTKAATCASCHGADGNSVTSEWPSLAGQHATYIARQLEAYQRGERTDVVMRPFAQGLSEQDIADLAAYYSAQTPVRRGADPGLVEMGERIYRGGIAERGVAACIACHGPRGQGNPLAAYPVVAGQHANYTLTTLRSYASGERRSDGAMNQMMRDIAADLREEEMRALASYLQGLH